MAIIRNFAARVDRERVARAGRLAVVVQTPEDAAFRLGGGWLGGEANANRQRLVGVQHQVVNEIEQLRAQLLGRVRRGDHDYQLAQP